MNGLKAHLKSYRVVKLLLPRYRKLQEEWQRVEKVLRPFYWRIPMSINGGVLSVELQADYVGFFATLTQVLYLFVHCDKHNYLPRVLLTGRSYLNPEVGPDWFRYFFEYRSPLLSHPKWQNPKYTLLVSNADELGIGKFLMPTFPQLGTTLSEARRIFFKYVQIKPEIKDSLQRFCKRHFLGKHVLGVHYRGTDKIAEAPAVRWERFLECISEQLQADRQIGTVFVASDEQGFIDYVRETLRGVNVVSHEDHYRSNDSGRTIHLTSEGDNYHKGRDAVLNALILSRCSSIIRTTSALSAWASVFNPKMKVILMNHPYDQSCWFPETEVLKTATLFSPPDKVPA